MTEVEQEAVEQQPERIYPSEKQIADIFVDRYAGEFCYVAKWRRWYHWTGKRWREDSTQLVGDKIAEICVELARPLTRRNEIRAVLRNATINGAERIASRDRQVAATVEQWDADPWLLNTPEGVVDLKTGETRPHKASDYMTKMTAVAPVNTSTPMWDEHAKKVFRSDKEMEAYFYRVAGYCLTGDVGEHCLFFCYGEGRNGKGTTVYVLKDIMGSYAQEVPMEMFAYKKFGHDHPTELTLLHKTRLAVATETEQGKGWSEARLKKLTGGDPIEARKMHQDWFEFEATHKLLFHGNFKPSLRSVGTAIRERMNMIPFLATFTGDDRVLNKGKQLLEAEGPGILHKVVNGCLEWQKNRLRPPKVVVEATNKYMDDQDTLRDWFTECVAPDPNGSGAHTATLFNSYKHWMEHMGLTMLHQKAFVSELEARATEFGITREANPFMIETGTTKVKARGFKGIKNVTSIF